MAAKGKTNYYSIHNFNGLLSHMCQCMSAIMPFLRVVLPMKVEASNRWEDSAQHRDHRFGSVHTSNHDSVVRIFLRVVKHQLYKFLFALCGTIFTRSVIPEGIVSSSPVNGNTQSCIAVIEVCTCDQ